MSEKVRKLRNYALTLRVRELHAAIRNEKLKAINEKLKAMYPTHATNK